MATDLVGDQLLNILVRYGKLDSWNCRGPKAESCKAYHGEKVPSDYSQAVSFPSYFVWEGKEVDGHDASVFLRSTQISEPYVKNPIDVERAAVKNSGTYAH